MGANFVVPGGNGYQVSKLALLRLTEFVNAEYGDKGVIATSIHPGGVVTELSKDIEVIAHCK
jgi:NAD(P)-dependent dehydrogenase (short-subunit alcohol dehydrogenase family)